MPVPSSFCGSLALVFVWALAFVSGDISSYASPPKKRAAKRKKPPTPRASKPKGKTPATTSIPRPPPHPEEAQLIRGQRSRSARCWLLLKAANDDLQRHRKLLPRRKIYPCDIQQWKDCKSGRLSREICRSEATQSRWYACFRIYRRLSVLTQRLVTLEKQGREASCEWALILPEERFLPVVFEPPPSKRR